MSIIGRRRPRNHNTHTNQLYFIQNQLYPIDDFTPLHSSPSINEINTSITQTSTKNNKRKRMAKTFRMNKKVKKFHLVLFTDAPHYL